MWLVWNWERCRAKRLSATRYLECMPYWRNTDHKILALNGRCRLSLGEVNFLVLFLFFVLDFLWSSGVADNRLGVLNSFCTLWGGVSCKKGTIWYGTGGKNFGTVTIWSCTGRDICDRVGVIVVTGRMIVGFLVAHPRSYATLTSIFLVMSPYYSDGTTDGVIFRIAKISVADWLSTDWSYDVAPLSEKYTPMKDIPIVSAATGFSSAYGRNYILVFHEALYMPDIRHTLINPNQCRHFWEKVQDNPYHEDWPMWIESPNGEFAACLKSIGTVMLLDTWFPTQGDLKSYPHIESTPRQDWYPHNIELPQKEICARGGRGAECLKCNNMFLRVDTRRHRSPTIWGYQRWLQKSHRGGNCSCRHGRLPHASCSWRSFHDDKCVSYIERK